MSKSSEPKLISYESALRTEPLFIEVRKWEGWMTQKDLARKWELTVDRVSQLMKEYRGYRFVITGTIVISLRNGEQQALKVYKKAMF